MLKIASIRHNVSNVTAETPVQLKEILENAGDLDNFTVRFEEVTLNPSSVSIYSLANRRRGDDRIIAQKSTKSLNVFLNYTKLGIEDSDFTIGYQTDDFINEEYKFLHEINPNNKKYNIVDDQGNFQLEPVVDPSTNKILLYPCPGVEEPLPKFRLLTICESGEENVIRDSSKGWEDKLEESFTGVEKDENGRKTPDYQNFLNNYYSYIKSISPKRKTSGFKNTPLKETKVEDLKMAVVE